MSQPAGGYEDDDDDDAGMSCAGTNEKLVNALCSLDGFILVAIRGKYPPPAVRVYGKT